MPNTRGNLLLGLGLTIAFASSVAGEPPGEGNAGEHRGEQGRTDLLGDPLPPGALLRLGTTRMRHQDFVKAVAFSPDGKRLASAGYDDLIRIWDFASGTQVKTVQMDRGFVDGLAYSPDGKLLAVGNNEKVRVFDTASGALLYCLTGQYGGPAQTLAFSPDGHLLATGTGRDDRAVHLWVLAEAREGKKPRRLAGPDGDVYSVAFSPDGRTLVACSRYGTDEERTNLVTLWQVASGKELWRTEGPKGVSSAAFAPDGKTIAAAGEAGPIRLYEAATGQPLPVADKDAIVVAFSPAGKALALGCQDGTVRLWEPRSGKDLLILRRHGSLVTAVAFSRDGKTLASGSRDGSLALWDVATGQDLHPYPGHNYQVMSVAFAPDGKTLASRGGDHTLRLWDTATGKERQRLDLASPADYLLKTPYSWDKDGNLTFFGPAAGYVRLDEDYFLAQRVAYSPDGKLLAATGLESSVHLWDAGSGKHLAELEGHKREVRCIAFAPVGKVLASGDRAGIIRLWDVASRKELRRLEWPQPPGRFREEVLALAFSPTGQTIAAGYSNQVIRLWDTGTGQLQPKELPYWGDSLAFLLDGQTLASLDIGRNDNGTIHLLDVLTGSDLISRRGHRGIIQAIAVSPDGKLLASAGETDRTVRVWELATAQQILWFEGHANAVLGLAFSPDSKTLASASRDTTLLLWDLLAPAGPPAVGAAKHLGSKDLGDLWGQLAAWDGTRAYQAMRTLVGTPDQAVAWFKDHLRPAPPERGRAVAQLLADLDAEDFAVREAAARELRARGKRIEPMLRAALQRAKSAEVRRQLQIFLEAMRDAKPDAETLRQVRAVMILERIGSQSALQVLGELGRGEPTAEQTRDAQAALARLERGPKDR